MDKNTQHQLPWQPLFTIERSNRAEVSVYGIVSVIEGTAQSSDLSLPLKSRYKTVLATGDTDYELWTRSLLKPWQLASHIDTLKRHYPDLKDEHFALFMASHSGEDCHLKALDEILAITKVSEDWLKCPQAKPVAAEMQQLKMEAKRRYHNCSGKHSSYLAALMAEHLPVDTYTDADRPHHQDLLRILSAIAGRAEQSFIHTTDGCQLPNYAMSTFELACSYQSLLMPVIDGLVFNNMPAKDDTFAKNMSHYHKLGQLMHEHPRLVSGDNRLDYKLMTNQYLPQDNGYVIAKEGADGLLGIGIKSAKYPYGAGLCIKLSSGFDKRHMELISKEIFKQLGLYQSGKDAKKSASDTIKTDHIKTNFHFELEQKLCLSQ